MELEDLRLEIARLEEMLEEASEKLHKAGEFGNALLSTNQQLNENLEAREKEHAEQLEELEQENYSLKMKLERQQVSSNSLQQELEATQTQLEKEQAMREKRMGEVHSKKILELTLLNEDSKAEIGKLSIQIKTLQERIKKQEEIIEQLREEISCRGDTSALHNELVDLENMYNSEKARCEGLELELMETRGQLEVAVMEISSLQQKSTELEEECLERNKMAKEWYDALQTSNDRNAELASQLELLKSKDTHRGDEHGASSGNSLFGEVDDRRINVEREMISLKIKYQSVEKMYSTTKQQLRKMKAEMSAVLCQYSATTADAAQVQRLQRALSQSKSEIRELSAKLHRVEQRQAEGEALQGVKQYVSAFVDLGDKAEYVRFLEGELEQAKTSHASVVKELDLKRTQLLWETNKLSEAEAKLYQSQQEHAKLKRDQTKLYLRHQETQEKLQQAHTATKQLEAEKKYLEEELKQRGRRKQLSTLNENQTSSDSHISSQTKPDSHVPATHNEELTSDPAAHAKPPSRVPRREINILEDLDKENLFNQSQLCVDPGRKDHGISLDLEKATQSAGPEDQASSPSQFDRFSLFDELSDEINGC